jgi:hypothetical protein
MSKLAEKHVGELNEECNKFCGEINLMYWTCVEYLDETNGRCQDGKCHSEFWKIL